MEVAEVGNGKALRTILNAKLLQAAGYQTAADVAGALASHTNTARPCRAPAPSQPSHSSRPSTGGVSAGFVLQLCMRCQVDAFQGHEARMCMLAHASSEGAEPTLSVVQRVQRLQ